MSIYLLLLPEMQCLTYISDEIVKVLDKLQTSRVTTVYSLYLKICNLNREMNM